MKEILVLLLVLLVLASVVSVMAKPITFSIPMKQALFQWRSCDGSFGDWTDTYQNHDTTGNEDVFTNTGNVIHVTPSWSPAVTNERGTSTSYEFNKPSNLWIQREGTMQYKLLDCYGDFEVRSFWIGYINFGGNVPSAENFIHGVNYQWIYIFRPHSDTSVTNANPNALWDDRVNAWLVGFSIYVYDSLGGTQGYSIEFPYPFLEPLPASIYNPLAI